MLDFFPMEKITLNGSLGTFGLAQHRAPYVCRLKNYFQTQKETDLEGTLPWELDLQERHFAFIILHFPLIMHQFPSYLLFYRTCQLTSELILFVNYTLLQIPFKFRKTFTLLSPFSSLPALDKAECRSIKIPGESLLSQ